MPKSYTISVDARPPGRGSAGERLLHWIAIGGPIGLIPWVPATFASAAVATVCWWLPPGWVTVLVVTLALYPLGAIAAGTAERLTGVQDPRNVVIDEVAGQLLTFLFILPSTWPLALAGFGLFRLFDVTKPFPAGRAEKLHAGWGVMTDDIVAGLYAAAALWVLARFF